MVHRYRDMEFRLYGRERDSLVEGVTNFKYMRRTLYQYDNNWPVICRNTRRVRKVLVFLEKVLWYEVADTHVLEKHYWVVVQAVLLF